MRILFIVILFSFLFSMTLTAGPPENELPPVMQEILDRHPSFTVIDSTETGIMKQKYYIGATRWLDQDKRSYWLNLNEKHHLDIYDCTLPENIVRVSAPLIEEPTIDIKTYFNFAYILLETKILVLGLSGFPQANVLGEIILDIEGRHKNLWIENDQLFILSQKVDDYRQCYISIYSLKHPLKIRRMHAISVEVQQPEFFYIRDRQAIIINKNKWVKKVRLKD